jgi:aspartyl-tRNA synthetase
MADKQYLKRGFYCGKIDEKALNKKIKVYGWVNKIRELGGITFIDLRDREGILQIVVKEDYSDIELVKKIGREYVLMVFGEVIKRSNPNPSLFSGNVELVAEKIEILSNSELSPFFPENNSDVSEELRFQYRYLDLRNQKMQENFKIRSEVDLRIRNYLSNQGFFNIETPMLSKATPEGARDYLVPSRIYKGKMFALPQSPQLFKQLLMVAGFERYFQIIKCFRDEDLRADRQPEFTQIDIEMSFAEPEELFKIVEDMFKEIFNVRKVNINTPFRLMTYNEVMHRYGSDKPDLRIPFEIKDFTEKVVKFNSNILNNIIENNGKIKGLVLPESSRYSRKILEDVNNYIREIEGKGAVWIKKTENDFKSSLKIEPEKLKNFYKENEINKNDIVFLIGDTSSQSLFLAGKLREYLGKELIDKDKLEFLWIVDFPMFSYNEEKKRLDSNHHPFTSPKLEDIEKLDSEPLNVKSIAYDLVLNGVEIGGGSRRINDINLQRKVFKLLELTDEEIDEKFGFFLNALKFGAPPHLGIAFGLDRIIMLLLGEESIREVIALCLLTGSPSKVPEKQLSELGVKFIEQE